MIKLKYTIGVAMVGALLGPSGAAAYASQPARVAPAVEADQGAPEGLDLGRLLASTPGTDPGYGTGSGGYGTGTGSGSGSGGYGSGSGGSGSGGYGSGSGG